MEKIKIITFGEFTLTYQKQTIAFDKEATAQMCSLLQLLVFHKHGISKDELINELWQNTANPVNALKYSIFRLRTVLNAYPCFQDVQLISTIKNGYIFAQDCEVTTDFDAVDALNEIICYEHSDKIDVVESAKQILLLYKGELFPNNHTNKAVQLRSFYQSTYEKALSIVCEAYLSQKSYQQLLTTAQQAINLNEYDDTAYTYCMRAFIELEDYQSANDLYTHILTLYERDLNHEPSTKIKAMHRIIASRDKAIMNVEQLKVHLNKQVQISSALFCDFETFRYVYHVALHNALRNKKEVFLFIFQLNYKKDNKNKQYYMNKLKSVMCRNLRSGDVVSKLNKSQMIALLPCDTMDNGYMITQRITSEFYKKVNQHIVRVHYFIAPTLDDN